MALTLRKIKEILDAKVLNGEDQLDTEIDYAFGCDLLSDVLAFMQPGALLLTGLVNPQSVRTASIAGAKAIVFVRGKMPDSITIEVAKELKIPVLSTSNIMFESCGKLYVEGIKAGGKVISKKDQTKVESA